MLFEGRLYTYQNDDKQTILTESLKAYLDYCKGENQFEQYFRMYQNIEKMFKGGKMTKVEKDKFWNKDEIMHYAYIDRPMSGRKKPAMDDYESSVRSFRDAVNMFEPDYIVVMGKGLNSKLEKVGALADVNSTILTTDSPAFPFFDKNHWHHELQRTVRKTLDYYFN